MAPETDNDRKTMTKQYKSLLVRTKVVPPVATSITITIKNYLSERLVADKHIRQNVGSSALH